MGLKEAIEFKFHGRLFHITLEEFPDTRKDEDEDESYIMCTVETKVGSTYTTVTKVYSATCYGEWSDALSDCIHFCVGYGGGWG